MIIKPNIFRDYDIRAVIPTELDMPGVVRFAEAIISFYKPKKIAIGYDARLTGKQILSHLTDTFLNFGINVTNLGQITTDMMTFAAGKYDFDLAIMITASHNPPEYNGFKMAVKGGVSVSGPTGFYQLRDLALSGKKLINNSVEKGKNISKNIYADWINYCFSFIKINKIKPLKVVIDTGNGIAGKLFGHKEILKRLPLEIIPLFFKPDGNFPNHIPNPLLQHNLLTLISTIKKEKADLGVALDGDGDRINFITDKGEIVSGTITTALIAESLLKKSPNNMILYNAVCGRIVAETVKKFGGKSKRVRVGYSLIKQEMVKTKALFAGEHSCHYFYKDAYNSEASLLTFLLILELISHKKQLFSHIVKAYDKYPVIEETNFEVKDTLKVMKGIEKVYKNKVDKFDWLDGISLWFKTFWVNIRPSNTQPLLRLNIEADNKQILAAKAKEFMDLIKSLGGKKVSE